MWCDLRTSSWLGGLMLLIGRTDIWRHHYGISNKLGRCDNVPSKSCQSLLLPELVSLTLTRRLVGHIGLKTFWCWWFWSLPISTLRRSAKRLFRRRRNSVRSSSTRKTTSSLLISQLKPSFSIWCRRIRPHCRLSHLRSSTKLNRRSSCTKHTVDYVLVLIGSSSKTSSRA